MSRIARITTGWILIAAGLIGVLLPVLPGFVFLASGIVMLAGDVPLFRRWICRLENRFPGVRRLILKMHEKGSGNVRKPPAPQ